MPEKLTTGELAERITEVYKRIPKAVFIHLRHAFRADAEEWHGKMLQRLSGKPLQSRTKTLARSLKTKVTGSSLRSLTSKKFSTGISKDYVLTQEFGTKGAGGSLPDIVSRRGTLGWLSIPVGKALTAGGVPRRDSPIDYGDFLHFRTGSRNEDTEAFLVPQGGGIADAYYLLRKKVAIPPRLGFFETHEKQASRRRRRYGLALARALASV